MRSKITGVLLLTGSLLVPVGIGATAEPAGAVGGTVCKKAVGTATFKPPLPKASSTTTVKPTVTIKGAKVSGCVGGGVTAGTLSATLKFHKASNCAKLIAGQSSNVYGPLKIVWANGKGTSTVGKATLAPVKGQPPTVQKVSGAVTLGKFKGSKLTATTLYTLPSDGSCNTKALSKVTFKLNKTSKRC
jgi:hypothetical protein